MRNQYKILAEKYNQIHENDARIGFERFLELQLIKFFKNLTTGPGPISDDINVMLDRYLISDDPDDGLPTKAEREQLYVNMIDRINYIFKTHPERVARIFPGLHIDDAIDRLNKWYNKQP